MNQPIRILAFWGASDFEEFFKPAFLNRPEYQIEIVSGDRSSGPSPYSVGRAELNRLGQRLRAGEFDLVLSGNIWNSPWPDHKGFWTSLAVAARFSTYKRRMLDTYWAPKIAAQAPQVPFAIVDLRDSAFVLPWDWPLLKQAHLYFKRELFFMPSRSLLSLRLMHGPKEVDPLVDKLRPLSYGVHPDRTAKQARPMAERDIDIFMSGADNSIRADLRARCRKLSSKFNVEVVDGWAYETDYQEMLQRSKLVVCTESFGCETWRQYEAASAGAIPFMNWPFTQNYLPFVPDQHAIYFSLIGNHFEQQIEKSLQNLDKLQAISTATREFTLECKSRQFIGDYVIKTALAHSSKSKPAIS